MEELSPVSAVFVEFAIRVVAVVHVVVVAVVVPDNGTAFGEGIGIESLATTASTLLVFTVILGYAIFFNLEG